MSRIATVTLVLVTISNLIVHVTIRDIERTDRLQNRMLQPFAPTPPPEGDDPLRAPRVPA